MSVRIAVDVELLVVNWLRTVDDLDGVAVHTAFGPDQTWPALRVLRLGGSRAWPAWVDQARIQIEGWSARVEDGGSKAEALTILEIALAELVHGLPGAHDQGVVSAVDVGLSPLWSPDEVANQPRYVADLFVISHPNNEGGS